MPTCLSSTARLAMSHSSKLSLEMLLPEPRDRALEVNYINLRLREGCRAVSLSFPSLDVCRHLLDSALLPGNRLACLAIRGFVLGREDELQSAGLSHPVFPVTLFAERSPLPGTACPNYLLKIAHRDTRYRLKEYWKSGRRDFLRIERRNLGLNQGTRSKLIELNVAVVGVIVTF